MVYEQQYSYGNKTLIINGLPYFHFFSAQSETSKWFKNGSQILKEGQLTYIRTYQVK